MTPLSQLCCIILHVFLFHDALITGQECQVSFGDATGQDSHLISAYNDAMGPPINLTYYDKAYEMSTNKLYTQLLRHPGGTVANYWSLKNATFVLPCKGDGYSYCNQYNQIVNNFPPNTFSPGNFYHGLSKSGNRSIVFVLNMLTLNASQRLQQIDTLINEIEDKSNIKYIELGNEYYLTKYNNTFPTAYDYINICYPIINKIREELPDAMVSVPIANNLKNQTRFIEWNYNISQTPEFIKAIDAVTIHDYTLNYGLLNHITSTQEQMTFSAVYGQSVIPQYVKYVNNTFGSINSEIKLFMTEYNWNINITKEQPYNWDESPLHSMSIMSYISSAICNSDILKILGLHTFVSQGYGNEYYWNVTHVSTQQNDTDNVYYGVVAEIMAHLTWVAIIKNNQLHCMMVTDGQCQKANVTVQNVNDLDCIFGAGFSNKNDKNSFGFFVVNVCPNDVSVGIDIGGLSILTENVELIYWMYLHDDIGTIHTYFQDCVSKNIDKLWECGPIMASQERVNMTKNETKINLKMSGLSVLISTTK